MKKSILQNVVWKEGKYYVAQCLNVDVSSFGETKEDALKNLDEALSLYFEDASDEKIQYDDGALAMLYKRVDDDLNGKSRSYSPEEFFATIRPVK